MQNASWYQSPLGRILLSADHGELTGLWFEGQKFFPKNLPPVTDAPIFDQAKSWLDQYFSGHNPDFSVPVHLTGTDFQVSVWKQLCAIPYGETTTYGQIANELHIGSAQAVGGAVGRNPISILVPCHRVLGAKGSLTGYAGGLEKKKFLLELEKPHP